MGLHISPRVRATLFICLLLLAQSVKAYTVVGNQIKDPNGNTVLLRGVDRCSLEWSATGENLSLQDYTNMKTLWNANVVRVALNQDSWLANTQSYQSTIAQQVTWIRQVGMGVIFDLHWNQGGQQNMADQNSITFWSQFAQAYGTNPWVIFELYNEPHDVSWTVWLNGDGNWAGMQQLYDAVREYADNMVIVNGLNYAFDLSGIGQGYAVSGTNIAYGTHPYDYSGKQSGDWPSAFGYLAPTYPVILTEFGQYCNTDTYVSDLLAYAQQNSLHWTAWAWYVNGCSFPSIIADWNGTPLGTVGQLVQNYLLQNNAGNTGSGSGTSGSGSGPSATSGSGSGVVTTGSVTIPPASGSLAVYTDSLQNGFQDWSWSTDYSLQDSTHVHSGSYAIKFNVQAYEALYFNAGSAFQLGTYNTIQFYVYGTTSLSASTFAVILYDTSSPKPVTIGTNQPFSTGVVANTWTLISVKLSSFGVAATTEISGFAIQGNIAGSDGYVWIDDISLEPVSGTTTGGRAATTTSKASSTTTLRALSTSTTATAGTVTTGASSSTCDASSITITQTPGTSWVAGGVTITQYAVTVSTTCASHVITALSLTVGSNWNPAGSWGATVTGTTLTFPSYVTISASAPYTGFGYQNAGEVTFTVASVTWQ